MKFKLTEELWKEGNMYVSYCPELDMASCGETVDQAKKEPEGSESNQLRRSSKDGHPG
jgi:hypothetical protein